MSMKSPNSTQPFLVALLLTLGFVACGSSKQSLNTDVGDGGEEGATPGGGSGGSSSAGKGSGAHAGRLVGDTGGGGPVAGSGAGPLGGSSNAGSAGDAGAPQGGSAGSPNGGVPNGGVAGSAGFSGSSGGGSGPIAGAAGGAGYPCDSSDGTGCNGRGFCVDHEQDSCAPDDTSDCSGTCATPHQATVCSPFLLSSSGGSASVPATGTVCPTDFECLADFDTYFGTDPTSICIGGRTPGCETSDDCGVGFTCRESDGDKRCLVDSAECWPPDACDTLLPSCPAGYAPADANVCDYVCVPVQHCGCEKDGDCQQPYSCDRERGRCAVPVAPAPRCTQPFDAGPCNVSVPAYAFVDGKCKAVTYGGCQGNDNRFGSHEECLAACDGMPQEKECGTGRVAQIGCLACGGGGGCTLSGSFCFESCETSDDCSTDGFSCSEGVCQVVGCL